MAQGPQGGPSLAVAAWGDAGDKRHRGPRVPTVPALGDGWQRGQSAREKELSVVIRAPRGGG